MPLIGLVGERSWRYAWIVLPFAAAILAGVAVARRRHEPPTPTPPARLIETLAAPGLRPWLVAEVLVNTAWAGTLVYSGALFVESYGASTRITGVLLAVAAGAYVMGNLVSRRFVDREARRLLVVLACVLALTTACFGLVRSSLAVSVLFFSAAAVAAGGRTFVSSAFGLSAPAELRPRAMALRAASMQFGYFTGSVAAGAALALGGYPALGCVLGALFLAAALPLCGSTEAHRANGYAELPQRPLVALSRGRG